MPICRECYNHLSTAKLPPLSYANDMWTGYGLQRIYQENATCIELACASPCLTSLVLISMEGKYKMQPGNTSAFDQEAHMARHRYGARGNVLTFPLPVEELLHKLTEFTEADANDVVPRSGKQMADVFRVILKTNKTGKATDEEVKTLIHQARVRRQAQGGHYKLHKYQIAV